MLTKRNIAIAVAALLVLIGGALVLLGGGDETEPVATTATTSTTTSTTTTTAVPGPVAPLTGLPSDVPANRPALIVKIDNGEPLARPQMGLNQADVVYEEMVEGGVTRFAVVFHSAGSDSVGPIRSGRTTDVAIASNLRRPLFAYSGANPGIQRTIRDSPLVDVGYDVATSAYVRRDDRRAPDNLYSTTDGLWAEAPEDAVAPQALFGYRLAGAALPSAAATVQGVDLAYTGSASVPVAYRWDADLGGWARTQKGTPHVDEADEQFAPENVIIQFVDYVNTGYFDVTGAPVPEAVLYGIGTGLVLVDGHAIEAQWGRDGPDDVTTWQDLDGRPIELTPGRTWVHLVPPGRATLVP